MIPYLFLLWFVLSCLFFFSLFRVLGFRFAHRFEEIFFAAAASLGWISFCAVTLGLFGLARPAPMYVAALATGLAAAPLLGKARRAESPPPVRGPAVYLLCAAALAWLPLVFIPPFFFDTLRYHYGLASAFLRTGLTYPLPHFVESSLSLGTEMLFMVAMAEASHFGANLVNLLLYALCGFGILCVADRLEARRAGWIGLLLFFSSSASVHILFLQKPDLGVTLFVFAFAYALLAWLAGKGEIRFLVFAAAMAGLSLGAKYTTVVLVCVTFALALGERIRAERGRSFVPLKEAVLFGLVVFAVFAPWLYRNFAATGNPVYPMLNDVFQSPSWSPARMEVFYNDAHLFRDKLHGWRDLAALLRSVTFFPDTALSGAGASLGAGVLGAFLFPVLVRRPPRGWAFVRNVSLALFAAWFFSSWVSRYLLPALPLMALLAGSLGDRLADRVGGRRGAAIAGVLLAVAVGAQAASTVSQSPVHKAWKAAFALMGHPERGLQVVERFHPSLGAVTFANARLPKDAKILLLGETRVYYLERSFVAPSAYDEHPIARLAAEGPDAETVRKRLAARGFTHILACRSEWERLGRQYYSRLWGKGEIEAADRFVRQLPEVYADRNATIYSLEGR